MSEKRIYCIEVSGECQHLMNVNRPSLAHLCGSSQGLYCTKNISWKPIVKETCKFCSAAEYLGITREQAIERIIKRMCPILCNVTCECCSYFNNEEGCKKFTNRVGFNRLAEAALNALLEANNDK